MYKPMLLLALSALVATAVSPARAEDPPRRVINLEGHGPDWPFSDAVLAGDTLYLAGRIGLDPKTRKPPADPKEEARIALDGMKEVLAEAGMTMDDLVTVQVYCSDVSLLETFNEVYQPYFTKGQYPARAFVGAGRLLFDARFEIQGIAVKR